MAACNNPEVACPKKKVICQMATLLANSVFVYHEPMRKMMIGPNPDSKKPIMNRKMYICVVFWAAAWAKLESVSKPCMATSRKSGLREYCPAEFAYNQAYSGGDSQGK